MLKILYILIAILMLGFIVTAHEFGHYLAGRICGIGIIEFSVGMGPKLFGWTRKGIKYSVRCIPLGGYCSFVGEDEDNPASNAMNRQPVWKRFLTVAAGPVMNFILAYLFCAVLLSNFITAEYLPRISFVYEDTPAYECGMQTGDEIRKMNDTEIVFSQQGIEQIHECILESNGEEPILFTLERDGELISVPVQPQIITDEESGTQTLQIGIAFGGRTYSFGESLSYSCRYMVEITRLMLESLRELIFQGEGAEDVMGPVGIISFVSDQVYNEKMYAVTNLIFILSLNIGIMNLLPLPALDGGRLIFLIVEAIRRKPIPPEKEGLVHAIGFGLLIILILFITYKDILRLFTGA